MDYAEIAKREGELISLPVEKLKGLIEAFDYIATYDLFEYVKSLYTTGILSPLKLTNDEFASTKDEEGNYVNIRYPFIIKTGNGKILNTMAHHILIRAKYNHDKKVQEEYTAKVLEAKPRLYISKGGVITGEYVDNFVIKDKYINNHKFEITSIPVIPVSIILRKNETYYVVDHRDHLWKDLNKYYDFPILVDERVQSMHMNLRVYTKINKQQK